MICYHKELVKMHLHSIRLSKTSYISSQMEKEPFLSWFLTFALYCVWHSPVFTFMRKMSFSTKKKERRNNNNNEKIYVQCIRAESSCIRKLLTAISCDRMNSHKFQWIFKFNKVVLNEMSINKHFVFDACFFMLLCRLFALTCISCMCSFLLLLQTTHNVGKFFFFSWKDVQYHSIYK